MSDKEKDVYKESEARILTQEEVDEIIRIYIVPLTKLLEDLIWFIQIFP